jgi:hypothetical protein
MLFLCSFCLFQIAVLAEDDVTRSRVADVGDGLQL